MDAKHHGEQAANKSSICSLEWIAWAIEAARRHKEAEHLNAGVGEQRDRRARRARK